MPLYRVLNSAVFRLQEIHRYTLERWGKTQADRYIEGLFACFERIARKQLVWRPIPAEFGVKGYFTHYRHHYVYWKELSSEEVGIVTVLHERMHQIERFSEDFLPESTQGD